MSTHKSSLVTSMGRFEAAFGSTAKARAALEPVSLMPINLDVQASVNTVLAALPAVRTQRDTIESELPAFDLAQFDKLETYAESLAYAQTAYLAASEPTQTLPTLVARGVALRDQLVADATALARRNLVDGKALSELKGGNGYLNVGSDVGVLVRVLRERWADIKGKSAIQPEELHEAEQLFEQITLAHAERSKQPVRVASAADDRVRAYTLLLTAYDQARRAINYLRWEENDLEKFAPSLWSGRGGRNGASAARATPANPQPSTPTPPAPAVPAAPAPHAVVATPSVPGMPGGSPFANG